MRDDHFITEVYLKTRITRIDVCGHVRAHTREEWRMGSPYRASEFWSSQFRSRRTT